MASDFGAPSVLLPYPGATDDVTMQDIFVYLRPESNGVLVESTILKVIQNDPDYKQKIFLIYLANIPGEFILKNHIVERHYMIKMKFAVHGGSLFTDIMKAEFEKRFGPIGRRRVVGSFEALQLLSKTPDELFGLWVAPEDYLFTSGQSIKRVNDIFVVNYDIPALLQKNDRETDIAVMIFRTSLSYPEFRHIFDAMENALREQKILAKGMPVNRIFHHSKGPFEQILDGRDYLYDREGNNVECENLSFARFLHAKGIETAVIRGAIMNPIVRYLLPDGREKENVIHLYTQDLNYEEAWERFRTISSQVLIPL